MTRILGIILILAFLVPAQNLDSIMNMGVQQVQHYKMMPLIPPEELFAKSVLDTVPILRPLPTFRVNETSIELDKRVRDLEINVTKISVILENMQKINEKHTDKFDSVMRFFEVIITAIAGIITALIGVYFKGRRKT